MEEMVKAFRDQGTIKQLNLEHRIQHPDGSLRWVQVQGEAICEGQPLPVRLIGTIVDITERKSAEEALRQSKERFTQFMQYLPGLAWIKDIHGRYVYANAAAEKAFGVPREKLYGKTDRDVFPPEVAAQFKKNDDQALMEAKGVQVVETLPQDDGVLHYSLVTKFPIPGADGQIALIGGTAFDVTEQRQMENALRESEERYRAIVNQATAGIVRKDAIGRLIFVNDAFCDMLGYSASELKEKTMWQITHPDDVQENQRLFNRLMVEGIPFRLEKRLIRRDGSILWATVSVSPVSDAAGKPQSAVSVYADITERKRIQDALHELNLQLEDRVQRRTAELQAANKFLRESEARSRLILESMPDAILITDKEGHIVYGNTQMESLFGYASQEVIGQPVEFLSPRRFHEQHVDYRAGYSKYPHRRYMGLGRDLFGQRKDQSEFPVDVMLSPISGNTNWDVMVTIRDNTEQKQAQEAWRTNEEKLRKLFEVLPVGISFLDSEGQITEMNSALTQVLGLSRRELLEGRFRQRRYIRSDGSPMPSSEFASIRARTEQKTIYNVETGIVKEDGETIWTSVNAAPVDIAEVDVVVATIDITERKKTEDVLHKNRERLRILSRRLVEVQEEERRALARELHDRVGQNLAALNLNLNILRRQLSSEALEAIGTRLDDSVSLVNQILTITRNVMTDLRSNVLDDYGLEAAIREYAEQFTLRTGIQVVSDRSAKPIPRLDPNIEMTLLRIAQEALTNVARHAQANQAAISVSTDEDAVYMSIQDDGIGILSWQRANQPGSHGLRIIRERAEAFGGSLQVQSTYKKGTRIDVKIPLIEASSEKVPREKRS
jgi:PAS domain S-box-containing protein